MRISNEDRRNYEEHGYFVREHAVSAETLEILRREADAAVAWQDARLLANGSAQDVTHHGRRYFIPFRSRERSALRPYVYGELMADVCRNTIGVDAWLFCEMFVVKSREVGLPFGWHQDSGYLDYFKHGTFPAYVTTWLALDDMTEENGTLYVLPFSEGGTRELVEHTLDTETNDKVADFGGHAGRPLVVSAGTLVVLSSLLPHRSGPNAGSASRSAYLCQYSPRPIVHPKTGEPILMAEAVLRGGVRCA